MIDRRSLLRASAAGLGALSLAPRLLAGQSGPSARIRERSGRPCLVLVQLTGGNDGLNTLVPYADDTYFNSRKSLAHEVRDLHRIDDRFAFAPTLSRTARLYREGRMGIVHGVGYPDPNRSHFKSYEIWHAADPRGRAAAPGWLGRVIAAKHGRNTDPHRMVHVGDQLPYSLHSSTHPALAFRTPKQYRWAGDGKPPVEFASDSGESTRRFDDEVEPGSNLDFLRGVMSDAMASSARVRDAVAGYRPAVEYPKGDFAQSLAVAAALLASDVPTEVLSVEHTGFDTHAGQVNTHARLLEELDEGLSTFLADLQAKVPQRRVLCLVYSEFGRRVAKNNSGGTDHGTAGPVFLFGSAVTAGQFGAPPSLTELDERGDLVFTTDFRSIYATVIRDLFGVDPEQVLGARYKTLPFLRT